ncbi:kinase-like domain-containing protein [Suillus fuscotomentosus]|uniref:Kinase-like domain-containing protein n=1 Tax=Suillus fuscotomentosus TaxID=1912939 RepID=A0AAD4HK21_9AGAM|nr:kinase-like domain-containing protein [Suillus fuscotomentosus]KAG1900525.1 kinase-like domain-containing protein [Suillus fuscotomentosus]
MASASTIECPIIPRKQLIKVKEFPAAVGGYGQVFQCIMQRAEAPEALVAVKVLIHVSKKRACREMKLWMAARHENIVPLFGIAEGFTEEGFAMVSPWMGGGTLALYLRDHEGNIPCRKKLTLIKDVTIGLAYLHSRKIVHGDLTTTNVVLDESGKALLIDFGLSNVLGGMAGSCLSLSVARPGAVRFAAPELLGAEEATSQPTGMDSAVDNEPPVLIPNVPSDIYSLGCVMLNVFTEKLPWYTYVYSNLAIVGAHHAKKSMPFPSHDHLSKERKQFICKCTSVEVGSRPSSQDAVVFIEEELRIEAPIRQSMTKASNRDIPTIVLHKLDTEIPSHIQEPIANAVGYLHPRGDGNTPTNTPSASSYSTCLTSQTTPSVTLHKLDPEIPSHIQEPIVDVISHLHPQGDGNSPSVSPSPSSYSTRSVSQPADAHEGTSSRIGNTSTVAQLSPLLSTTSMPDSNDSPVLVDSSTRKCTVVIAGAVGSGKSSLVNLLSRKSVAGTSIDAGRCTGELKEYPMSFRDTAYRVFDTVGFACSNGPSSVPKERPKKHEKRQIGEISGQGSIDLILLCVPSRNFRVQAVLDIHNKIQGELNGRKVPVVLVVTHFEEQQPSPATHTIDRWWSENSSTFRTQLNSIAKHTCITLSHDKYLDESREHIFRIMAQYRASDAGELPQRSSGGGHSTSPFRALLDDVVRALHIKQLSAQVRGVVTSGLSLRPRPS